MNAIISKFLLTGDNSIPELHLKQLGFTYSACGPFLKEFKNLETHQKTFRKHLYRNQLDQACFAHDAAYSNREYYFK